LTAELKGYINQQARINKIFELRNKNKEGCCLCPDAKSPHKFLRCDKLCQLCEANNWTEYLVETKMRNQAFAEKELQEEASASSSIKKPGDVLKKLEERVTARKTALEAAQSEITPEVPSEDDNTDGRSQDTQSTIKTK